MKTRFYAAMACYAAIAIAGTIQLDGKTRIALWLFLAALALKTWIHNKRLDS